ncbi:MAG: class I SAM-dependent methyltransferase [Candidatus Nanoarchaeia archaeon]|nr:class I SAM-dependent methyltransferase [Candidatus Nanoarchaeia archaeon]
MRFECFGKKKAVWKCTKCGLVQLLPQWTDKQLDKLYEGYNKKQDFAGAKPKKTITKYLKKYIKKTDSVLEIGAGNGDNLLYLYGQGYHHVMGIDKDPELGIGIAKLSFNEFVEMCPNTKFDFIYGIQVLEHIADPVDFVSKVINQLTDGGRFLFEIPNLEEPLLTIYKNKAFEKFYWYPYHLFFYDPNAILAILHKASSGQPFFITRYQRYGLINHLRWAIFNKPGNWNPNIPVLDWIYKSVLKYVFKKTDTMIIEGYKWPRKV